MHSERIAISATFTAEPIEEFLAFWVEQLALPFSVSFAPFNQVFQQLVEPASLLATGKGVNVVLLRLEDLQRGALDIQALESSLSDLVSAVNASAQRNPIAHLICFCPPSREFTRTPADAEALRALEARISAELSALANVQCLTSTELDAQYSVSDYHDSGAEKLGKIPYTRAFFAALGTAIGRKLYALRSLPYKVIAVDCDQTLWKGVCGEVGAAGVEIDALRRALQEFLVQQHDAGMLLCLASKNDERDVEAVFQHYSDMPLKLEHFVARRVNWKPKSQNLKSLAEELNVGVDSVMLLDDSPIECSEVEANLPGVLTLQLPAESSAIPQFLRNIWALGARTSTREDRQRTQYYAQDRQREEQRAASLTFADFLARLELQVAIEPLKRAQLGRVAQLTQRTNQFNTTTIRRSDAELERICEAQGYECLTVEARDRFGEYGLVGAVIFRPETTTLRVDTLLLSCRALGRGIEHRMLAKLGQLAVARELDAVAIPYIPSARNEPARLFLESITGATVQKRANGFVATMPAAAAAELRFNGEQPAQTVAKAARTSEQPLVTASWTPAVLKRIATELCTPEQIVQAVDRWKKRTRPDLQEDYIAPRNDREQHVATVWQEVLGLDRVGIHDNFFELGGNSILGTLLVNRLSQEASLSLLFEYPTVAGMAAQLKSNARVLATALPVIEPDPAQRFEPFPLTDTQQAYWIGRSPSIELGNIGCHIYEEVDVPGLDLARFRVALRKLIERHDMLRAVILPDGRQQIRREVPEPEVTVYDLRGADRDTLAAHYDFVRRSMSHQVLPTDRAPLLEFRATLLDGGAVRLHRSTDRLISDALSDRIMVAELHAFYHDPNACLLPLALSFRDYVYGELSLLKTELHERSQAYWLKKIPKLPPPPELPLERSSAQMTQPRFIRYTTRFERETWTQLKANCASAGITPPVALLAAYADVLATWSKNRNFSLNLTVMNRFPLHPQVNQLIGDGTSVSILAIEPAEKDDFTARARKLQAQLWEDLDHRYFSGVRVLRELIRAGGGTPRAVMPVVFTSTLNLDELGGQTGASWSAFGKVAYGITQTAQVWLDNQVCEEDGTLGINWDAVEGLFPEGMLQDMFETYVKRIHELAESETVWHSAARSLVPLHHLRQREQVNETGSLIPPWLLHTRFEEQAAKQPNHPAVIGSRTLTYRQLMNCSTAIATRLRTLGTKRNQLVAVVMEKGWEQVAGVLAVLQSGSAYLPIDPEMPRERLAYLLENAQVRFALTTSDVEQRVSWPEQIQRLIVDDTHAETTAAALEPVQSPTDLAYVIYTSGSTGKPKGVVIDHRGAVNTIVDVNQRFNVGPNDRVLALSSLSFDLSVYDVFGMLAAGGTIVMPEKALARDPGHWFDRVRADRVTIWNTVPTLMEMLANHAQGLNELLPESLRVIMMSGDWIPMSLPPRLKELARGAQVYSLGGATEASIWSIIYRVGELDPSWKSVPYGKPMVNQTFHVLNERLEPCPVWVPGFLYIGGIGLAKGYWRDPEKTAASFIEHPRTGERLYRTGDMGRYLPDGNIEFLGRIDHQVKIRGFRIELGEIEAALAQHATVKDAVVTAREDAPGEKRLAAYIIPKDEKVPTVSDLRVFLREKLPEYMVPAAFVVLGKLPLSSNGKVDRKALPAPDAARVDTGAEYVAPRTPIEESLCSIVAELLKLKRAGIHDNFFDLGGDSILATQLLTRITHRFATEINLFELFQQPTVAGLAELLTRKQVENVDPEDLAKILGELEELPEKSDTKISVGVPFANPRTH